MEAVRAVLAVVAIGVGALVLVAVAGFILSIHPPRYRSAATPASAFGWSYERVTLEAEDGPRLAAWLIPRKVQDAAHPELVEGPDPLRHPEQSEGSVGETTAHPEPIEGPEPVVRQAHHERAQSPPPLGREGGAAVIVLHGYPYSKADVLGVTEYLHPHYDLLLPDLRYFGESEGAVTSLGHREWRDVAAAARFLRERGYESVGVWGFSMGASVTLVALGQEVGIDAVVADSPFSDLHEMTLDYYGRLPVVAGAMAAITDVLARVVFGVGLGDISPARGAAKSDVPLLLIHGAADRTIPLAHHERLRAALDGNGKVEAWVIEGGEHGRTYSADAVGYEARVLDFFARNLR